MASDNGKGGDKFFKPDPAMIPRPFHVIVVRVAVPAAHLNKKLLLAFAGGTVSVVEVMSQHALLANAKDVPLRLQLVPAQAAGLRSMPRPLPPAQVVAEAGPRQ